MFNDDSKSSTPTPCPTTFYTNTLPPPATRLAKHFIKSTVLTKEGILRNNMVFEF